MVVEFDRRTNSAGKRVMVLLEADEPLSKANLAEQADFSKKTVYYRQKLDVHRVGRRAARR